MKPKAFLALYDETDAAVVRWLLLHLAAMQVGGWDAAEAAQAARGAARQLADSAVDAAVAELAAIIEGWAA